MTSLPPFECLTDTDAKAKAILEGSCIESDVTSGPELLDAWIASRKFIVGAIDGPGTILDYGCANGYLLRCLMEWVPHELVPFGVDINEVRLRQAKRLLAGFEHNLTNEARRNTQIQPVGYDFVYWAIGDNVDFVHPENHRWLSEVEQLVAHGGRLIVGLYGDRSLNARRLVELQQAGRSIDGIIYNDRGPESLVWFDQSSDEQCSNRP